MDFMTADYPCVADIIIALEVYIQTFDESSRLHDTDELVYDTISLWDKVFENDDEWYNEDDTDIKDSLRDQVLEFLDW